MTLSCERAIEESSMKAHFSTMLTIWSLSSSTASSMNGTLQTVGLARIETTFYLRSFGHQTRKQAAQLIAIFVAEFLVLIWNCGTADRTVDVRLPSTRQDLCFPPAALDAILLSILAIDISNPSDDFHRIFHQMLSFRKCPRTNRPVNHSFTNTDGDIWT